MDDIDDLKQLKVPSLRNRHNNLRHFLCGGNIRIFKHQFRIQRDQKVFLAFLAGKYITVFSSVTFLSNVNPGLINPYSDY